MLHVPKTAAVATEIEAPMTAMSWDSTIGSITIPIPIPWQAQRNS
jgi:hypothetical protein